MKKFTFAFLGCLTGILTGIIYFFGATIVGYADSFTFELIVPAVAGFAVFAVINCLVYWLTKKKSKPFALAFIISAFAIDVAILIILSSVRNYT